MVRTLRDEVTRFFNKDQLPMFARRRLNEHQLLIEHDRTLRTRIVAALDLPEGQTGPSIAATESAGRAVVLLKRCSADSGTTGRGRRYCRAVRMLVGSAPGWLVRNGLMSSPPRRV